VLFFIHKEDAVEHLHISPLGIETAYLFLVVSLAGQIQVSDVKKKLGGHELRVAPTDRPIEPATAT
jgi:hypothetical protein